MHQSKSNTFSLRGWNNFYYT